MQCDQNLKLMNDFGKSLNVFGKSHDVWAHAGPSWPYFCSDDSQETHSRQGQLCKWTSVAWFEVGEKHSPAQILLIFISTEESHCNLCLNWRPAVTQPPQNKKKNTQSLCEKSLGKVFSASAILPSLRRLQPPYFYSCTDFQQFK